MATIFPRAVVWDVDKHHHVSIVVDRASSRLLYECLDCGDEFDLPLDKLETLRTIISHDDDAQVVFWLEVPRG